MYKNDGYDHFKFQKKGSNQYKYKEKQPWNSFTWNRKSNFLICRWQLKAPKKCLKIILEGTASAAIWALCKFENQHTLMGERDCKNKVGLKIILEGTAPAAIWAFVILAKKYQINTPYFIHYFCLFKHLLLLFLILK